MTGSSCRGHQNGFHHLVIDLSGAEDGFDLGFRFERKHSDEFRIHPATGEKIWYEPFLALYVSYAPSVPGEGPEGSLRFALTQSKLRGESAQGDEADLLGRAREPLAQALQALKQGQDAMATEAWRFL